MGYWDYLYSDPPKKESRSPNRKRKTRKSFFAFGKVLHKTYGKPFCILLLATTTTAGIAIGLKSIFHQNQNLPRINIEPLDPESTAPPKENSYQEKYTRTFTFSDATGKRHQLSHSFTGNIIRENDDGYGVVYADLNHSRQTLADNFNTLHKGKAEVTIGKDLSYNIRYPKTEETLVAEFEKAHDDLINSYHQTQRIHLDTKTKRVMPDFKNIQLWQAPFVEPLFQNIFTMATSSGMNERELIYTLASFVQEIPYALPTNDPGRDNLGFWPPVTTLVKQKGDCDSKSTLLASLAYNHRKSATILILTERHAFIGFRGLHRTQPTDQVLRVGGVDYLLIETTNPGWGIGHVSKETLNEIRLQGYKHIAFH